MGFFSSPNVDKLAAKRDLGGLAKALTNKDPAIRDQAARALAEIDDPASVPLVVEQLSGKDDEGVIEAGASALRAMGDDAARVLVEGLHGGDPSARPANAALLGRLGEEHGLAPLLEASREADPALRGTAAMSLGLIGGQHATARITEIFHEDDDMDARGLAALALATGDLPGAYDTFVAALDAPDPLTRALGAMGLGMLGDACAAQDLERIASGDADERVRERAQSALAELAV